MIRRAAGPAKLTWARGLQTMELIGLAGEGTALSVLTTASLPLQLCHELTASPLLWAKPRQLRLRQEPASAPGLWGQRLPPPPVPANLPSRPS